MGVITLSQMLTKDEAIILKEKMNSLLTVIKQKLQTLWMYAYNAFEDANARNVFEIGSIFLGFAIDIFLIGFFVYLAYEFRSVFFIIFGGGLFLIGGILCAVGYGFAE